MKSNVIPIPQRHEYVNVHGKPLALSMQRLVQDLRPDAWITHRRATNGDGVTRDLYTVKLREAGEEAFLGSGGTPEGAWRSAYFNLVEDEA